MREEKKIKRPLLYVTGGLVLGETMALFLTVWQGFFWLAVLLLLFLGGSRLPAFLSCRKVPALLILLGVLSGLFVMEREEEMFSREEGFFRAAPGEGMDVGGLSGDGPSVRLRVTGTVLSMEEREKGMRLELSGCRAQAGEETADIRRVFCYTEDDFGLRPGQKISVEGTGSGADGARNPGGFNYRLYCRAKGIGGIVYASDVFVEDRRFLPVSDGLYRLRESLHEQILKIALPEDAGILSAVLLGDKTELDSSVYELYRKNGISHLLAISGLHVSILGLGVWKCLRKGGAGFYLSGVLAGIFLISYGKMTGFGPSAARAVMMACISFLASALGRTYDLLSALCVPAVFLLITRPYALTQAAFQLSFLAVGAAGVLGQALVREWDRTVCSDRKPVPAGMLGHAVRAFLASVSIQAVTAPVILYHSFELPVYGVFLNVLVIPLMTCVVVSGFLGLFVSFVAPVWGAALLGGAHYILKLYGWLCAGAEKLPFSSVVFGKPQWWQMAVYYGCLAVGMWVMKTVGERCFARGDSPEAGFRKCFFGPISVLLALWCAGSMFLLPLPSRGLSVTFLDVDQGDGIFLEAGGSRMLVDCGSAKEKEIGKNCLVPFLKSRGITELDTVLVTHGDFDHINGVRFILEEDTGIRVGRLILPKAGAGEVYEELKAAAEKRKIPVLFMEKGDSLGSPFGDGISISCLYPSADSACRNRNEESLVLMLKYGRFSMLLTGDVESDGETELLESGELSPVTVLKAAHHGSASSTGKELLEAVSPDWVVLSYGRRNRYGHPAAETVERLKKSGARIVSTAESGAVFVWTDGKRVKVRRMGAALDR